MRGKESNLRPSGYEPGSLPLTYPAIVWSEYKDSNLGPPAPKAGALPDCATLRINWYLVTGSNRRQPPCKDGTLPTELTRQNLERVARIELANKPWQGFRLPLHHTRMYLLYVNSTYLSTEISKIFWPPR